MIGELLTGLAAIGMALLFLIGAGYVALWFIRTLDKIFN